MRYKMKKWVLIWGVILSLASNAQADVSDITTWEQDFNQCTKKFEAEEKKCSDSWKTTCYEYRMSLNKDTQNCYQKVAVGLFENFYDLSKQEAVKRFDEYKNFIYSQYDFIYNETSYCKKNNCGIALDLYSEYATTQELEIYVYIIIKSISARN